MPMTMIVDCEATSCVLFWRRCEESDNVTLWRGGVGMMGVDWAVALKQCFYARIVPDKIYIYISIY